MPAPKNTSEFCALHETHDEKLKDHETRLREVEHKQERQGMKLSIFVAILAGVGGAILNAILSQAGG